VDAIDGGNGAFEFTALLMQGKIHISPQSVRGW
jgi:hypothetical protein